MMVQGLEDHLPYSMGGEVRHIMAGSLSPTSSTTSTSSPSPASTIPQDSDSDQSTESTKAANKTSSPQQQQQQLGGAEVRRYRTAFTREQINRLEREFQSESYINRVRRCELAEELELGESTIKIWFQNRRMKDKRQKISIPWPYTNPTLAAYLLHSAAGTYSPYLPHPAAPWPATIGLGATNPLAYGHQGVAPPLHYGPQGLSYPTPVQPVPSVARFAPYPRLHPATSLSPSYPDAHRQFSRTHLPNCPALTSPVESCLCAVFNSSVPHHGLPLSHSTTHSHVLPGTSSPLTPSHSSGSRSCSGSEGPSREASPVAQSQSPHSLSIFPVTISSSSSPSISSSSSSRSPACRLFRPYDDEPSPKM